VKPKNLNQIWDSNPEFGLGSKCHGFQTVDTRLLQNTFWNKRWCSEITCIKFPHIKSKFHFVKWFNQSDWMTFGLPYQLNYILFYLTNFCQLLLFNYHKNILFYSHISQLHSILTPPTPEKLEAWNLSCTIPT